jgi:hypothetical protein
VAIVMAGLAILAIGPRHDVRFAIQTPAFLAVAVATALTGLLAGISALVLSVPGEERSPLQRSVPIAAGMLWVGLLAGELARAEAPVARVLAMPIHWPCVAEIALVAFVPGWMLFGMLRRAAPLHLAWSAALASLASVGVGAVAAQVICPLNDPAHHLVGHVLPVVVFSAVGALAGRSGLGWQRRVQ